ncbi:hypothetical protein MRBBS_1745 [Marinobacter sp. BSs20148]|nr:hypothetical protein MRBBS_1745 [Marinobacter sp. BSs20148]
MGGVEGDDQLIFRFALGKIDARMMIQLLNEVPPLNLSKTLDGKFASEQKLSLACCFMSFRHEFPLSAGVLSLYHNTPG